MRRLHSREEVTGGDLLVEVWDNDGDRWIEWVIPYHADVTPVRAATYWQPAEGGEVENLEFGEAVCTQTRQVMSWAEFVEKVIQTDDQIRQIEEACETAIGEQHNYCTVVLDPEKAVA
jgi:hypothetical protein